MSHNSQHYAAKMHFLSFHAQLLVLCLPLQIASFQVNLRTLPPSATFTTIRRRSLWLGRPRHHDVAPMTCRDSRAFPIPRVGQTLLASSVDAESDIDRSSSESSMGAWVPVGSKSSLSGLDPTEIEMFGHKFVVWQDPSKKITNQSWSVLTNVCPHRMAPLSWGRVNPATNCLECPYHGWQFDGQGTLTSIPHLEPGGNLMTEKRSVQSFSVHETGDLIWAFLPTSFHGESFPRSLLPEHYYADLQEVVDRSPSFFSQEMALSYDFLGEGSVAF